MRWIYLLLPFDLAAGNPQECTWSSGRCDTWAHHLHVCGCGGREHAGIQNLPTHCCYCRRLAISMLLRIIVFLSSSIRVNCMIYSRLTWFFKGFQMLYTFCFCVFCFLFHFFLLLGNPSHSRVWYSFITDNSYSFVIFRIYRYWLLSSPLHLHCSLLKRNKKVCEIIYIDPLLCQMHTIKAKEYLEWV